MIDFTRAFDLSMQRTSIILWKPLNFEKWLKLGFAALLSLMATGGVTANLPRYNFSQPKPPASGDLHAMFHFYKEVFSNLFDTSSPLGLLYTFLSFTIPILSMFVFVWIGARGQFIFIDNIVRNRVALGEPWSRYARQGFSWFLLFSGLQVINFVITGAIGASALAVSWTSIRDEVMPGSSQILVLVILALIYLTYLIVLAAVFALLRDFAVPLMFSRGISAFSATGKIFKLTARAPLSIFVYLLIQTALAFVFGFLAIMVFCIFCCFTACLTAIPLLGNLLLLAALCQIFLPLFVFQRCFSLDCLTQLGPEYDVWTVDVPTAGTGISLQPPLG